ncbi:MAG TPA: hypothetical protein VGO55_01235 [Allosphingosinicella sp.]|jgi:hypothetical protein|nr:hypothetical protein [Allosphingosinicella sp.]
MARLWAALLLCLVAAPAFASDGPSALHWLEGRWRGTGTMFGQASEAVLEVRPALGGRFLEFSYRAGRFEGRAFYRPAGEGRWQATWFDNRGITFPIQAVLAGQTLTADWGSAETERGRTIYRLLPDGRLEVTDSAGGRAFASHVLARAD